MPKPSSSSNLSRRSFLLSAGAGAVAGAGVGTVDAVAVVETRAVAATSTDEWVRLWELPATPPQQVPAVFDETVFVPSGGVVRSVDAETGDASWVQSVGDPIVHEGLLATEDRLYAGAESGMVHCLNTTDGEPIWSQSVGAAVEGLAAAGEVLVVQTGDALHALDAGDGTSNWQTPVDGTGTDRPVPPVTDGRIVVGSSGESVFALALDSGAVDWTRQRASGDEVQSLAVRDDSVIVGGAAATVMLTLDAGDQLWTRPSGASQLTVETGSSVYAMNTDGTAAIDPESGGTVLTLDVRTAPDGDGGLGVGEIEPHGTTVLLSGERDGTPTLVVVDPGTGDTLWQLSANEGGDGFGRAVLADERLIVQDYEQDITFAYGEPSDEMATVIPTVTETPTPDSTPTPAGGEEPASDGSGFGFDTTIAVISLIVTIIAGLVGVAQYLHERKQ